MRNSLVLPLVLATAALPLVGLRAAAGEPAAEHGHRLGDATSTSGPVM